VTGIPIPDVPLHPFFEGLRSRLTPELRQAIKVILSALLQEAEPLVPEGGSKRKKKAKKRPRRSRQAPRSPKKKAKRK
jgi:hypothetical protein